MTEEYTRKQISLRRQEMVSKVRWGWFSDIGWHPHRYQVWAHNSLARYRTTCAGRRGGKSEWAGREASAYCIAGPFRVWVVAPSYDLGFKEFRVISGSLFHRANPYKILHFVENKKAGQMTISLDNGAECEVISIDKPRKSGHGEEVDLIILSETGLMDNIGGEDGVWNKTLIGAMASRHAEVILPTTPQGQDDFLYPMFMKGLVPDSPYSLYKLPGGRDLNLIDFYSSGIDHDPEYFSLQWPSWVNTEGFLEDIAKLYRDLPIRIFMEQLGGFFVKWSGSIWLNDFCYDPGDCVINRFYIPIWWRRIEVIDPGYSGLFAWIAAYISPDGDIYIVDEYSAQRTLFKDHVEEIQRRRREFCAINGYTYDPGGHIPVYIDPEDPQCRAELSALGLACTAANNDIIAGFQAGGSRFKNGQLKLFSNCTDLDQALRNHEWAKTRMEGGKAKEAQDKWKHFSDLVRYLNLAAIWPSEKPKEPTQELTVGDLFEMTKGSDTDFMDMAIDEWERLHVAA